MKAPIFVEIDWESAACYVRYSTAPVDRTRAVLPSALVAVDVDASGAVVGIEILQLSNRAVVGIAEHYAVHNGLGFPAHLDAQLVPTRL